MISWRHLLLGPTAVMTLTAWAVPAAAQVPPSVPTPAPGAEAVPPAEVIHSWALTPAGADNPDGNGGRSNLSYTADPGAVIEDAVTLYNFGTEQLTFRVYATDAFNNADGTFDLLPGEQDPTQVGSWVTLDQELITVAPGQQATIPMKVTIPPDATPGDHAGGVVASSPTFGPGPQGDLIQFDRRIGTRLYVRVNGPVTQDLVVSDVSTDFSQSANPLGSAATVTYTIQNRGNVRAGGTGAVSVSGPFGVGKQTVTIDDLPELLPGEEVTRTIDVADVPGLFVGNATVTVTPNDDDAASSSKSARDFVPPVAILGLLLAVIVGLLAMRSIRRRRTPPEPSPAVVDAVAHDSEPQLTR